MNDFTQLRGRRVLVVEDNFLIAGAVCDALEAIGAVSLGPIGQVDEALRFLAASRGGIDFAVLDVDLHGEKSYPIADALVARGLPFVFTTGYSADAVDAAYRDYPRCNKPFNERDLFAALLAARCIA